MTFFFAKKALLNLADLGIEIPFTDQRGTKVHEFLLKNNRTVVDWDGEFLLSKSDYLHGGHNQQFVNDIFGSTESKEARVKEAFELINADGSFNRFNPKNANQSLEKIVERAMLNTEMTYRAATHALENKFSYHLGGGYHHAMTFGGRGFCVVNDIVIVLRKLQAENKIKTAWVIDVDAHKGDGTAELTQDDESIKTFSIHMGESWPMDMGDQSSPWFIPNDIEIPIKKGSGESHQKDYLDKLSDGLERMSKFETPDICLVVQGSDPYEKDVLPSTSHLMLTKETLLKRDLMVYNILKSRDIPQVYTMSGGYGLEVYEIYINFLSNILKEL